MLTCFSGSSEEITGDVRRLMWAMLSDFLCTNCKQPLLAAERLGPKSMSYLDFRKATGKSANYRRVRKSQASSHITGRHAPTHLVGLLSLDAVAEVLQP